MSGQIHAGWRPGAGGGGRWGARRWCWLVLVVLFNACASTEIPQNTDDVGRPGNDAGQDIVQPLDAGVPGEGDAGGDVQEVADARHDAEQPAPDARVPDGGAADDVEVCVPQTCASLGACGTVSDGCGGELACPACPEVSATTIFGARRRILQVGERLVLDAKATDVGGQPTYCDFSWGSLNPAVARVAAGGEVTGVAPGITEIRVECRGVRDSVRVYVNDSGLPAALTRPDTLALWLRADVGLSFSSGAQVKQWEDMSGNGHIFGHDDFSHQPRRLLSAVGAQPAVRFNGTNELKMQVGALTLGETTIFAVLKNSDEAHRGQILASCISGARSQLRFNATPTGLYLYGEVNGLDTALTLGRVTTEFQSLTLVLSASRLRVLQDDQQQVNMALSTRGPWTLDRVGARCDADYLRGEIAEIMAFQRALDDTEIAQVRAYLTARYGF